ncbi:class I SAM-dependent methyltransferase [Cytophaga hutchinsonii]|jgi:SAM-dependent methyltransferase|uniref:Glycosylase or SAM-dependent methyltransferase n=1 Tax=Cytophaga hutchinsonii (strain ATCC 33406 / DSM 1761 / CIP 103989 / NBRC 15051 / NCIMB 9469 / D465) TaxID=269798 RepID=A0A6N4SU00_CYTH3|nr:methyltransferase domain-containing protein [Cytophaga hutchinsonii]ABG59800.1 glycosylase or SAM-dependent methyltransferase [Cytophaga hutchinsonii ATCC 33406]SFX29577.1 Methyltransferase domain-containing protein [Cytophaga hutchinsonii ATCC 33406]
MRKVLGLAKRIIKSTVVKLQQIYFQIFGSKVECNICHYKANKLNSDSWHAYCTCPNCSSGVRQRLLMASFTLLDRFNFHSIIDKKNVLHFAPEKALGALIQQRAKEYRTADFFAEGYSYKNIDYNIDISDMKTIQTETFDCVIACDVLEHVPDHIGGIREVYRILKNEGYCIFTVPQKDHLQVTFEDLSITDKKERERIFGQYDHLRIYGDDFTTILQNAGFEVTAVDEHFFDKHVAAHYVLFPPVLSQHPLATNYRKIFFGRKI